MVCACEREAGQYRAEFVVFPRQCLVDGVYQFWAQPFGQPLGGGVAQGHGFAGDGKLVFQPGPGEAEQGLAYGYVATNQWWQQVNRTSPQDGGHKTVTWPQNGYVAPPNWGYKYFPKEMVCGAYLRWKA